MAIPVHRGIEAFKCLCKQLIEEDMPQGTKLEDKDLPEVLFEGLDDITQLPDGSPIKYFAGNDSEHGWFCVISGKICEHKYCEDMDNEAVAIAIGLWDKERKCFSALAKTKDGKILPPPFRVKGASIKAACKNALDLFHHTVSDTRLESALIFYGKKANQYQVI